VHETNFEDAQKLRTLIAMVCARETFCYIHFPFLNNPVTSFKQNAASMVNSVADSGHAYARRYASSTLTPAMSHAEIYGGMTQVDFMNKLANTEDLSDVISKLQVCKTRTIYCSPQRFYLYIYFSLGAVDR